MSIYPWWQVADDVLEDGGDRLRLREALCRAISAGEITPLTKSGLHMDRLDLPLPVGTNAPFVLEENVNSWFKENDYPYEWKPNQSLELVCGADRESQGAVAPAVKAHVAEIGKRTRGAPLKPNSLRAEERSGSLAKNANAAAARIRQRTRRTGKISLAEIANELLKTEYKSAGWSKEYIAGGLNSSMLLKDA